MEVLKYDCVKEFIRRPKIQISVLFLCTFIFNLVLSFFLKYPIINDEFCIMSDAASLSGRYDWSAAYNSSVNGYWGYGFSIFLVPFFWLFDSIDVIYHIGLALNAVLVGLCAVIAYKISRNYIKQSNSFIAWMCSLVIALFPGVTFYSKMLLNETMLIFIAWLCLYLLLKLQEELKTRVIYIFSFLLGAIATYAYGVHGRGIAITASVVIIMLYIRFIQKKGRLSAFLIGVVSTYVIDKVIKSVLYSKLIFTDPAETYNTAEKVLSSHLEFLKPENLKGLLTAVTAQSYYLVCVTGGLFCLFIGLIVWIIINLKKKWFKENKALVITSIFSAGCVFLTLGISSLYYAFVFVQHDTIRREYIIYGRYNDTIIVLALFCVLNYFFLKLPGKKVVIFLSIIPFLVIVGLGSTKIANWLVSYAYRSLSYVMVEGIIPIGGNDFLEHVDYNVCWRIAFTVLCIFVLFIVLLKKKSKNFFLLVLALSLYSTWYSFEHYFFSSTKTSYESTEEAADFLRTFDISGDRVYLIDYSGRTLNLQTKMPELEFYMLSTENSGYEEYDKLQENSLIISSSNKQLDYYLPNCKQIDTKSHIFIWAYGSELQQTLEDQGIVFKNNVKSLELELDNFATSSGDSVFNDKIYLMPGEILYGPYLQVPAGVYHISIKGEGFDEASVSVTDNLGETKIRLDDLYKVDNYIEFNIEPSVNLLNFEIVMTNISQNNIISVDDISIVRENEKFIGDFKYLADSITTIMWRNASSIANYVELGNNSYQGQSIGKIFKDGEIKIKNLNLALGTYHLIFQGENMDGSICSAFHLEDNRDIELVNIETSSESLIYEFSIEEDCDDLVIILRSTNEYTEVLNDTIKIQYMYE